MKFSCIKTEVEHRIAVQRFFVFFSCRISFLICLTSDAQLLILREFPLSVFFSVSCDRASNNNYNGSNNNGNNAHFANSSLHLFIDNWKLQTCCELPYTLVPHTSPCSVPICMCSLTICHS